METIELMGLAEVAEYYGVSKQVISNWRNRDKLPKPGWKLAQGPVWQASTIRQHPRPTKAGAGQ